METDGSPRARALSGKTVWTFFVVDLLVVVIGNDKGFFRVGSELGGDRSGLIESAPGIPWKKAKVGWWVLVGGQPGYLHWDKIHFGHFEAPTNNDKLPTVQRKEKFSF